MSNLVVHAPELSRYELLAGDGGQLLGFVDYRPAGARVTSPARGRASAPSSSAARSTRSARRAGR